MTEFSFRILHTVLTNKAIPRKDFNNILTILFLSLNTSEPFEDSIKKRCEEILENRDAVLSKGLLRKICHDNFVVRRSVLALAALWSNFPTNVYYDIFSKEFSLVKDDPEQVYELGEILDAFLSRYVEETNRYRYYLRYMLRHQNLHIRKVAVEAASLLKFPSSGDLSIILDGVSSKDSSFRLRCVNALAHLLGQKGDLPQRIPNFFVKSDLKGKLKSAAKCHKNVRGWRDQILAMFKTRLRDAGLRDL